MTSKRSGQDQKMVRGRSKSTRERVRTFLRLFRRDDTVLILIYPDPDSMASALAVKRLLWKHVRKTQIAYAGKIQRLENQAMMELLKIPMVEIDKVPSDNFNRWVLVDSQPHHSEIFEQFSYDTISDHHPKAKNWDAPYVDIRPGYGATSKSLSSRRSQARYGCNPSIPFLAQTPDILPIWHFLFFGIWKRDQNQSSATQVEPWQMLVKQAPKIGKIKSQL